MGSDDSDEVDKHDRVLAPDDLDITNRPEVEEIDDGRYVVSPNGPAKKPDRELLENPDWLDSETDEDTDSEPARPQKPSSTDPSRRDTEQSTPANRTTQSEQQQSTPTEPPQSEAHPTSSTTRSQPAGEAQQSPAGGQPTASGQPTPSEQPSNQPTQSTPASQQSTAESQPTAQPTEQRESPPASRSDQPTNRELAAHDQPPAEPPAAEITNENVSKFLAQSLAQASGDYGFDATVNVEGNVNRGRMTSDDIGETLETLLRWYAKQTTDEVDPEHVLGIILAGSDLAVEYPVQSAYAVVKQHGLGPDDTISDLLSAVREEGSFTVPPSKE